MLFVSIPVRVRMQIVFQKNKMILQSVQLRDAVMQRIRAFFHAQGFLEVETPIRIKTPCMELHIDAEPSGNSFLRTSPELFHKRLLAEGCEKIFEIGKCFRQGEFGQLHHPEYTMLEWYHTQTDYYDALNETKNLLAQIYPELPTHWKLFSIEEIFEKYAGWNPIKNYNAERFDIDLVEKIDPALAHFSAPVVLIDYPIQAAALARAKPNNPTLAERWELYICGVEIANAYSELIDSNEQRRRFEACAKERKKLGKPIYKIDEEFLNALRKMPPTSGVALGVDRLLMLMINAKNLDEILPFRKS